MSALTQLRTFLFLCTVLLSCSQLMAQTPAPSGSQTNRPPNRNARDPKMDAYYKLSPDSMPQEGVPKGRIEGPKVIQSEAYPGTQHTYWVYVPAQYDPAKPAALMIFNDGQAFKNEPGDVQAHHVMDNLIYRREIPVMFGVFINPGRRPNQPEANPQEW